MTKLEAILAITEVVESKQGCKATELVSSVSLIEVFEKFGLEIIDDAVRDGSIKEIVYVLPDMDYREKSFLLPGKTKIFFK